MKSFRLLPHAILRESAAIRSIGTMCLATFLQLLAIVSMGLVTTAAGAEPNDPILGKWTWHTKSTKVFHADGTVSPENGNVAKTGKWRCVNPGEVPRKYVIDWPNSKFVDTVYLKNNDSLLVGTNQQGQAVWGGRLSREDTGKEDSPSPAQPAAPVPPELQAAAAELVKTYHDSLVFITGDDGAGSGFVASYGTGCVLFTNAHVAAGVKDPAFKSMDGTKLKVGPAACAVDHDAFIFQAPQAVKPFEIMMGVDGQVAIGDAVLVLGNAEGAGVINTIVGKIVGIGPDLVEIDAPFQPGNSGSPIIHLKSGKVIGVATYATIQHYDALTQQRTSKPIVRRFGYRLDNIKSWQTIDWRTFYAQAAEAAAIEKLTGILGEYLREIASQSRLSVSAHERPDIKNRIDGWIAARVRGTSNEAAASADHTFLSYLNVLCQADVKGARQHMTYDYFQRELANQQTERNEIQRVFTEIVRDVVVQRGNAARK